MAAASAAAWLLAGVAARSALTYDGTDWRMPEYPAQPPASHPYLIMNPKSGGGKVGKFDLKRKAEALGAEVFMIGGPTPSGYRRGGPEGHGRRRSTSSEPPGVTGPRPWSPASPPSTAFPSW